MGDVQSAGTDVFDPAFYVSHYPDLAGLTQRAAEAHFRKWGRGEGRQPNAAALLDALQRQYGRLPDDFDPQAYCRLNPDIGNGLSDAQAAMHYLVTGRASRLAYSYDDWARRSERTRRLAGGDRQPDTLVHRSWVAERRHDLALVFGPSLATDLLTRAVMRAMAACAKAPATVASPYMAPAVIGRFLLSAPKREDEDFATLRTQLRALFYVLFDCRGRIARRAAEMQIVNDLARRVVDAEIALCRGGLPPLTLFMAAARNTRSDFDLDRDLAEPDRAVAEFFGSDVINLDLQRFVTSDQRAALRAPGADGRPLGLAVRQTGWSERVARRLVLGESAEKTDWFLTEGAWAMGMDYVLEGDQVAAGQVRIETGDDGAEVLVVPPLLSQFGPPSGPDREEARRWIGRFREPETLGLPSPILSPSALEFVAGLQGKKRLAGPLDAAPMRRTGAPAVQPSDLVVFGERGNGDALLLEGGWGKDSAAGAGMEGHSAEIAIPLTVGPEASLDLFLDLRPGDSEDDLELQVLWNGRLVSSRRSRFDSPHWTHIYLGSDHRPAGEPNFLVLWAPSPPLLEPDRPIATLQRLMLALR